MSKLSGTRSIACGGVALVSLLLWVADVSGAAQIGLPNCNTSCGGVSVPYPFSFVIEAKCYLRGFELLCNQSYTPPRLFFQRSPLQVVDISLDDAMITYRPRLVSMGPAKVPKPTDVDLGLHTFVKHWKLAWEVGSSALGPYERRPGNETCPRDLGTLLCHSSYGTCEAATGPYTDYNYTTGYVCKCNAGFQGNAYLSDGCRDINECTLPDKCFGDCTNLHGSYLCECPKGTIGDPYTRNGCIKSHHTYPGLIIALGVGSGALLLFLSLGTPFIIHKIKIRRKRKLRQRFFEQNHGQLLERLVCQRAHIAQRMLIALEELEKATNNFDKARELDGGGHGIVYKGILTSLHVVTIKKSKIVVQKEIDNFINEVAILSQVNHRNIVKLLGCCLETEVPLLVYEFISNGTLYNHLHVKALVSLSWKDRLRIAVETAGAIVYLHSLVSMPIVHRDIKSPNILLDDNFTVKLSDFGASRYIPIDQSGVDTTVQGTFGYLDPMYHRIGHLTDKSDVYSFGVILIELLTRKKPVSYRSPQGHSLVHHFVTLLSKNKLTDILDLQVLKEGGGDVIDVALLAAICVKLVDRDRPTMRQVEMTLEGIHAAREDVPSDMTDDESDDNYVQVNGPNFGATSQD